MAASSTQLGDIEEWYFTCSVCLDSLKEPKILQCLHRYCRGCLHGVIAGKKNSFKCPLCQEECDIPTEGVAGFRTDFHIKSVVEFHQLGKAYKKDNVKKCYGCKETKTVTSYCFKCKNFLCQQCCQFHLNNDMIAEHRTHILDLNTVDVRSLTLQKLASLTEDPRCTVHVKHLAQLCCETCGNLPICVACTYGDHDNHNIHDVKKLARSEREKLQAEIEEVEKCKDKLYALPKRVETVREQLEAKVKEQLEKARSQQKEALKRVLKRAESDKNKLAEQRKDIIARKEKDCNRIKEELEEEMKKLTARYHKILKKKERIYDKEIRQVDEKTGLIDKKCSAENDELSRLLQHFEEKVRTSQLNNEQQILEVSNHSKHRISRYENFTATATTVLASNDEWTDVQCLPAITAAGKPLVEDAKKDYAELESLSDTKIKDLSLLDADKVKLTECQEFVVDMNYIGDKGWQVWGTTSIRDGHIIVTGCASGGKSHITVIDREGGLIRQDQIERVSGSRHVPRCYCHSLSQSLVATVCQSNQVGIYDVSNGKYVKKDIKDISIKWPGYVTCVATDTQNNIYVGGNGRHVLVLDDQLNYHHTIKLPRNINFPYDIAVHGNDLLVCDQNGNESYAVTTERGKAKVVYQFTKTDGVGWPISVCIDSNQYIYMLWRGFSQRILTQYSQDGRQLLTTRRVDKNARCITTMETDEGEKLLVATGNTTKLFAFGLTE